ncbi:MAG TPA: hypothetical protein VFZ09_44585 [Archangium sp.]|uniref:hypothetical protein n=1 Tax=Archangium sp. TaxID=1872627 RepID=UPI002E35D486|nr:hypothetical protein [Archangium sp.]HEX5753361.1 hypothetical protein [Archangium sp.]
MSRMLRMTTWAQVRAELDALKPHLAYGPCDKREDEALHAMHLADPLCAVQRSPAPHAA